MKLLHKTIAQTNRSLCCGGKCINFRTFQTTSTAHLVRPHMYNDINRKFLFLNGIWDVNFSRINLEEKNVTNQIENVTLSQLKKNGT
jgi:hypothetical protein